MRVGVILVLLRQFPKPRLAWQRDGDTVSTAGIVSESVSEGEDRKEERQRDGGRMKHGLQKKERVRILVGEVE